MGFRGDLPAQSTLLGESQKRAAYGVGCRGDTSLVEDASCRETAAEHLRMIFMRARTREPFRLLKTGLGKCLSCPICHFFAPASLITIGSDVPRG